MCYPNSPVSYSCTPWPTENPETLILDPMSHSHTQCFRQVMGVKMKLKLFLFLCCTRTSLGDQAEASAPLPIDKRCHSNLFDEAVELLSTHTVKRLETQILGNENSLKEKENEVEILKLELEKKQQEMENALKEKEEEVEQVKLELEKKQDEVEKSWTLVSYMMNVMSSSQEIMKSKDELVETQAAKIEEMKEQISEYAQMTEDTVRRLNISHSVIEAQEKTIDELRKVVTADSKLTDTYRELKEGSLVQTNCDVPPYLTLMTDSLNSQQEEISELKAVL